MNEKSLVNLSLGRTSFRLVSLVDDSYSIFLEPNNTKEVFPGIFVTLGSSDGEALLEVMNSSQAESIPVYLNESLVFDIAEVLPGDRIKIGPQEFVYLKPMQVYVRPKQQEALDRLDEILSNNIDMVCVRELFTSLQNSKKEFGKASPLFKTKKSKIMLGFTVFAFCGFAGLVIMKNGVFGKANISEVAGDSSLAAHSQSVPSKDPEVQKITQKETSISKESTESNKTITTPVVEEKTAPKDVSQSVKKVAAKSVASTKPQVTVQKVQKPKRVISSAEAAKAKRLLQEYILEAKFDPEGAKRKLNKLYMQVPKETDLAEQIKSVISRL